MTDEEMRLAREAGIADGTAAGRIDSLESRFDRFEAKLDQLSHQISSRHGAEQLAQWIIGLALIVAGWFANRIFFSSSKGG